MWADKERLDSSLARFHLVAFVLFHADFVLLCLPSVLGTSDPDCYAVARPRCRSQRLVVLVSLREEGEDEEGEREMEFDDAFGSNFFSAITVVTEDRPRTWTEMRMTETMKVSFSLIRGSVLEQRRRWEVELRLLGFEILSI